MMLIRRFLFLILTVVSFLPKDCKAQIAQFDFPATNSLVVSSKDANVSVTNFALTTGTIETNITTGTYFPNEPYVEESGGWTSIVQLGAKAYQFTITANAGYVFSITNISLRAYATSAGPSAFGISLDGSSVFSTNAPDQVLVVVNTPIAGQTNLTTKTISIEGWLNGSRASTGAGVFRIDDIVISGTVTCIAPPANPSGTISNGANPACGNTTLSYSSPSASIYWQTSASGTSTLSPTISDLNISTSGTYYARSFDGTCWSASAVASAAITINTAPSITAQPTNPAAVCGTYSGNLSVTSSGLSRQWEYSADGTTGWASVANNTPNAGVTYTNATTGTLGIAGLTQTGYYRCVVSSAGCPSVNSNAALVTVNPIPATPTGTITPAANPACTNTTLSYSGASASIYWQTTAGGTSTTFPTTSTYLVSSTNTYFVRALSGSCWSTGALSSGTITINTAPSITVQPTNPAAVCGTYSGNLSVTSSGLSRQWEYSADGTTGWASVANNTPNAGVTYTNATTNTLTINGLTQTGYYRCVVSTPGCASVISNTATVTVNLIPSAPLATAGTLITSDAFTANWNTVLGATDYFVDVYSLAANVTVVAWNFPTSGLTLTPPTTFSSNNSTQALTTNASGTPGQLTPASSVAGIDTYAPFYQGWQSGNKFWQMSFNSTGFTNLKLSSRQRSSDAGPRDFKVQYRIGTGAWTDLGVNITVANNFTTGVVSNISLPASCDNQASVTVQWIMTSNIAADGGSIASTANSSIDDILVTGSTLSYITDYENVQSTDNSMEVTGLASNTTYYYVVRASNGNCLSSNSNEIAVTTLVPCTPTASISSFQPSTGPAGTLVTITGSGFTGATGVKFGNTSSSTFTVVNNTTIIAEVPTNAPSDIIKVTVSGCDAASSSGFTFINQVGTCGAAGGTASDLFISEVYDAFSGSLSYIEIFNATGATVNLSGYTLRFVTGSNTITDYALSGSIPNNSTFIIRVGTGSPSCPSVTVSLSFPSGSGFNGNDRIYLRKGGTNIDYVENPNYGGGSDPGFSQIRKPTAVGPSTTYNESDWTNTTTETCSDLGLPPFSTNGAVINITSHPVDVSCSSVTFSVSATTSGTGSDVYVWYYNDPSTQTGWSLVSSLTNVTVTGSGTNSISITGNTAELLNYQFYCEITRGSCTQISNAAQFTYASLPIYRSKANGNWTTIATWEMANTPSGPWTSPVCNYPVAANSSQVIIQNGTTVTLDKDLNIDLLTVEPTGIFQTATDGNSQLTVLNSNAGSDFIVNGTYIDHSNSLNSLTLSSSASWSLGAAATIIKTNDGLATTYRDNYELGMSSIPSTANWIIRYLGTNNVSFTTVNTFYPNLTIESTSGSWTPTVSFSKFTGNSGFTTVKGNMDVGGAGPGTVSIANINTNATPFLIQGNLTVRSGSSLANNDGSATFGTGFEVRGNVSVDGALTINGITPAPANAKLVLSGPVNPSTIQTISGSGAMNLLDVVINNSGDGVTLLRPVSMNGVLTLQDGLVNTSLTNLLTLTASASSTPGSDASFVNGPIKKIGNTAFAFPVGKPVQNNTPSVYNPTGLTGGWRPLSISAPTDITDAFTAEFMHFNANLIGTITSPGLQGVSACEYWGLKRESSTEVDVSLTWKQKSICTPAAYVTNATPVVVAVSSNGTPKLHTSGNWTNHGGGGSFTTPPYEGTSTWPKVSAAFYKNPSLPNYAGFTPFTLGTTNWQQAPLPYTLSTFKATAKDKVVQLDWQVLHNDRVKSYTVERSKDGVRFAPLKLVAARVNEQNAAYIDNDPAPFKGWGYYRLRITDFDGNSTYSATQKVWMGNAPIVQVSPNPVKDQLFINTANMAVKEISLINYLGQTLLRTIPISSNTMLDLSKFNAGVYYVRILTNEGVLTEQVIKQ